MRLAILGGSFNPIHLGHLFLADTVLSSLHYDRVALVPAYCSPFKPDVSGMGKNAHERLEMIAASISGDPRLTVDDCEIRREGVSYTVDTVRDIIRRYTPEGKPGLIIGDDLADDFPKWNKSNELLVLADIIIARRVHSDTLHIPYPAVQITNGVIEISSGTVREKIAADSGWRYLVPAAARNIIEERGLYDFPSPVQTGFVQEAAVPANGIENGLVETSVNNLIHHVEEAAREMLSLERFLHSRNTALLAWDMCRRVGNLDPQLGYLAGIAHDLGKSLSDKEQIKLAKRDGKRISPLEKEKPSLLHGRASAVLLKEHFNVHNKAVLEAVALHTGGGENMGPLAKVVYVADKMEVSREKVDPIAKKLTYTENNLDRIFAAVLNQNVSSLRSRKIKLSEETLRLLQKMEKLGAL